MYERCLNETERLLATSKDVLLPIKEVWRLLAAEGKRRSFDVPALTDFDALLEGDRRFEILSAQTDPDEIESVLSEDGGDSVANLGTLGFYPEDRVKLRRIKLVPQNSDDEIPSGDLREDEDVVSLNVKGLSTTKPVRAVEAQKLISKKNLKKPAAKTPSTIRVGSKKKTGKKHPSRKSIYKSSHKTR